MATKYVYKIRKQIDRNPFMDSQSRTYSEDQTISEFFPTSVFWSIFNSQNEIYLGTRGSGKTILMRMASYKLLREMTSLKAKEIIQKRKYVCFFVPLNLEFATSVVSSSLNNEYFLFSANCLSVEAFIDTLICVFDDVFGKECRRKDIEIQLTEEICRELAISNECVVLNDIRSEIATLYNKADPWNDGEAHSVPTIMYKEFLTPVLRIIDIINRHIQDIFESTTWIACIDEAEFLQESHLRCVNTFMRSTKKHLAIKMTTLPTKHTTCETTIKGIQIDSNGNDFNYRSIDYDCDSGEYIDLTNFIFRNRLQKIRDKEYQSLEEFFGVCGRSDDPFDYFVSALGVGEPEARSFIKEELIRELSQKRRDRYAKIKEESGKVSSQYIEKFSPAFYLRYAKKQNGQANKTFAWYLGSRTIRKMSDGNPRRFIEIMNYLFNELLARDMTKKELHNTIVKYAKEEEKRIQSLPEYGFLLKAFCDKIGNMLSEKIHGEILFDYGCNFYIDGALLANKHIENAIKLGIDYNHIKLVSNKYEQIDSDSHLRLSYIHAVVHWLPMRVVDHPTPKILPKHFAIVFEDEYFNSKNSLQLLGNYGLEIKNDAQ